MDQQKWLNIIKKGLHCLREKAVLQLFNADGTKPFKCGEKDSIVEEKEKYTTRKIHNETERPRRERLQENNVLYFDCKRI